MPRILHVLAILVLVGSAVYLYRVKYETIYLSEQVAKLKREIAKEKDTISMLRAEWQQLNSPERLQRLAYANSRLTTLRVTQIVTWHDIPERSVHLDMIGDKLMSLGVDDLTTGSVHSGPAGNKPTAGKKISTSRGQSGEN